MKLKQLLRTCLLFLGMSSLVAGSALAQVKKSLVVGIDGMGFGDKGFSVASTPNMDALIDGTWSPGYNGAYSDQAFAGGVLGTPTQQVTVSGPGWTTMLTGVWADQHNVTGNGFSNPDVANNPAYLGTAKANDNSLVTATFLWWPILNASIVEPINNDGDANNDLDYQLVTENDAATVADVVERLNMNGFGDLDADLSFVELDDGDAAGHRCGSSGQCYEDELEELDSQVGQILTAIRGRPTFDSEDWQVIVSADHGHLPAGGHGGQSTIERTIPFIVSSRTLNQGTLPQGVSHADIAPTVLDHFGIPIPAHYAGMSRAGGEFQGNPDINGDGMVSGDGSGMFQDDDVVAFISLWLTTGTPGNPNPADLNGDGIANLADWGILNAADPSMGSAILAALAGHSVPEPSTAVMGFLLALQLIGRRWPRKS
ncbi:alkaline phosphatase family protein [Pirellulales bacterium]|nr:alkaline phosphatase family protein [Pirellulales bacterium]